MASADSRLAARAARTPTYRGSTQRPAPVGVVGPRGPAWALASGLAALAVFLIGGLLHSDAAVRPVLSPPGPYDFDGDGLATLVVGTRSPNLTGTVMLVPRGLPDLRREGVRLLTQRSFGRAGRHGVGGPFASSDFNRDGFDDLVDGRGLVTYGSAAGLRTRGVSLFRQAAGTLAVSDFDGDTFPDLAASGTRTTSIFFAGERGLSKRDPAIHSSTGGVASAAGGEERAMTAADFDRDGSAELVIGGGRHISVCRLERMSSLLCQNAPVGVHRSMDSGDVNGDGYPDLVIGAPDSPTRLGAGRLYVIPGDAHGLDPDRRIVVTQDSDGVPGHNQPGDLFGHSVAVGDVNQDGIADAVIGAPGEDREGGRVTLLYGSRFGFAEHGNRLWSPDTPGMAARSEKAAARGGYGSLGTDLALLDDNGDGSLDLSAVAATSRGANVVTYLPGTGRDFTTSGSYHLSLADLGPAAAELNIGH